jgi:hypothetical protein
MASRAVGPVTVTPAPVEVTVTVTPSSVTYATAVVYRATVAGQVGGGPARSGSVQFTVGPTIVCTASVVSGVASCRSALAPLGADQTVTGTFGGAVRYLSGSGTATLSVDPVGTTALTVRP